jgi:hypothetical protein
VTSSDLVVNGEDTDSWFQAIGADQNVPAWVQTEVAKLFVAQIASDADRAEIQKMNRDPRPGDYGALIPKTRIYVRVRGIHKDAAVFLAGLLATLVTHGAAVPVVAPGVVSLWTRVSLLTSDQRAMFAVIQRVAEQKSLSFYKDWIPQEEILAAWPNGNRQQALRLLAELKEAGAITGTGNEWKAVL